MVTMIRSGRGDIHLSTPPTALMMGMARQGGGTGDGSDDENGGTGGTGVSSDDENGGTGGNVSNGGGSGGDGIGGVDGGGGDGGGGGRGGGGGGGSASASIGIYRHLSAKIGC